MRPIGARVELQVTRVQDGRESEKYDSLDKVPDAYRDKVKALVEIVEKPSIKAEVKPKE